jgi:hypothetical protein
VISFGFSVVRDQFSVFSVVSCQFAWLSLW